MNIDESWKYLSPTKIVFGQHSFDSLKKYVLDLNTRQNILLVTGRESMKKYGYVRRCKRMLYDYSLHMYDRVPPNPTVEVIQEALNFVGNAEIELVIALGGGSALDVGKCLAMLIKNQGKPMAYLSGESTFRNKGLPFIAIPTTSGTASEVTAWGTIWDMVNKKKFSLGHEWMFPDYAIIDPLLTIHMPRYLTACTGMDALTHAIESCWSRNAQPISDSFALRAIKLVRKNLKTAWEEPGNITARTNMAMASLFAGLAFNNTKTAACHSISYPMTCHFGIPHGLAVSITLKEVIKYNNKVVPDKVDQIIEEFGSGSLEDFMDNLSELMRSIDLPTTLSELNIKESDIKFLVDRSANPERMKNNPYDLGSKDIEAILKNIY
tara:strand:- start:133 stop:1272 length:1140 start_codon:yes stop_codon:yes gene_type:complete